LVTYLCPVLRPYIALSEFTVWWQFLPLSGYPLYETLTLLIYLSHTVSLVKHSLLQIRALQMVAAVGFNKIRKRRCIYQTG